MRLLLIGTGLGIVGGLVPSPLHLISVAQVALRRWRRALLILIGPPLFIDTALLILTLFFFRYIPQNIAHYVAYAGGVLLLILGAFALNEMRHDAGSGASATAEGVTYASVIGASLAEVSSPGTWVYWLTLAGPILAEGRHRGYLHVAPFFAGGLLGYYGSAIVSVYLLSCGSKIHKSFNRRIALAANILLLVLGVSYLVNAIFGR